VSPRAVQERFDDCHFFVMKNAPEHSRKQRFPDCRILQSFDNSETNTRPPVDTFWFSLSSQSVIHA
jgi:hypothetical protein